LFSKHLFKHTKIEWLESANCGMQKGAKYIYGSTVAWVSYVGMLFPYYKTMRGTREEGGLLPSLGHVSVMNQSQLFATQS
jgi:hypothetical protein